MIYYLSHRSGQRFTGYHCESDMHLYNRRLLEIKRTVSLIKELKHWISNISRNFQEKNLNILKTFLLNINKALHLLFEAYKIFKSIQNYCKKNDLALEKKNYISNLDSPNILKFVRTEIFR